MLKNNFANNFGILMRRKGLSQGDFGKIIGKGRSVVGSYIRGESEPDFNVLLKIADYFGISTEVLLSGDVEKSDGKAYMKLLEENALASEDDANYITSHEDDKDLQKKFELFRELFGSSSNKKLDLIVQNQVKILKRLDRDLLIDHIERIKKELKAEQKKEND